jgi:hypothetical protein
MESLGAGTEAWSTGVRPWPLPVNRTNPERFRQRPVVDVPAARYDLATGNRQGGGAPPDPARDPPTATAMNVVLPLIVPFVVQWLMFFAAIYMVVEYGQTYLYDETTPNMGLKVLIASVLLAAVQTWARTAYETMFTSEIAKTLLQAIVWFAVFTLVLRFHPPHALAIGLVAMVLLTGAANLAATSLSGRPGSSAPTSSRAASKPLRKSIGTSIPNAPATGGLPEKQEPAAADEDTP